jgi:ABC-type Fe3+-hydroxamate transport system substrate-binding protein
MNFVSLTSRSNLRVPTLLLLALAVALLPAYAQTTSGESTTQERDLRVEKDVPVTVTDTAGDEVVIPRSYALVVGVGKYGNLGSKYALQCAERDAE